MSGAIGQKSFTGTYEIILEYNEKVVGMDSVFPIKLFMNDSSNPSGT